jgi:hypothetical protein
MKTAPHCPASLDITPSDFCFYGSVKGRLSGRSFMGAAEGFEAVRGILNNI